MSSDVCDTVLEYFPTKTSWYQDQESERKKFEDMIQCASRITEAIDARVQKYIRNRKDSSEGVCDVLAGRADQL